MFRVIIIFLCLLEFSLDSLHFCFHFFSLLFIEPVEQSSIITNTLNNRKKKKNMHFHYICILNKERCPSICMTNLAVVLLPWKSSLFTAPQTVKVKFHLYNQKIILDFPHSFKISWRVNIELISALRIFFCIIKSFFKTRHQFTW